MKFKRLKAILRSELTDTHQLPVVYGYIAEGQQVAVNIDTDPPEALANTFDGMFGGIVGVAVNSAGSGEPCFIAPLKFGIATGENTVLVKLREVGLPDYEHVLVVEEYE